MFGFVEILSGIIRVGPVCRKYLDPFERALAFASVDGETAILKALVTEEDDPLTQGQAKAIMRVVRLAGLKPDWSRAPKIVT